MRPGHVRLGALALVLGGCSQDLKSPLSPVDQVGVSVTKNLGGELSLANPNVLRAAAIQQNERRGPGHNNSQFAQSSQITQFA